MIKYSAHVLTHRDKELLETVTKENLDAFLTKYDKKIEYILAIGIKNILERGSHKQVYFYKETFEDFDRLQVLKDRLKLVCKVNGYSYYDKSDERLTKDFGDKLKTIKNPDDIWRIDDLIREKADHIALF